MPKSFLSGLWALAALLVFSGAATAQAQQDSPAPKDLWIPLVESGGQVDRNELETILIEALGSASGSTHIIGTRGLRQSLGDNGFVVPDCFQGLGTCDSQVEAAARGLGADRVITLTALGRTGENLRLDILDVELDQRTSLEIWGAGLREAVFNAVGSLTTATARLTVRSTPSGANVYIDGTHVGHTPYESTRSVGTYALRVALDGYYEYGSTLELRANDNRREDIMLEQRFAEVVIQSTTPGAYVVVNGQEHRVGQPISIAPGTRTVEVRAPGHEPIERSLELVAAESRTFSVTLVESTSAEASRKRDVLRGRQFSLQLGFVGAGHRTGWSGAALDYDDSPHFIRCPVDPSDAWGDCLERTRIGAIGGDLQLLWRWSIFEFAPFGFSYSRINFGSDRNVFNLDTTGETVTAEFGRQYVWHVAGVGVQFLVHPDWTIYGRVSADLAFRRFMVTGPDGDEIKVSRNDWLLSPYVGARFHMGTVFYAFAEMQIGIPLGIEYERTSVGANVGLGFTFRQRLRPPAIDMGTPAPEAPEPPGAL